MAPASPAELLVWIVWGVLVAMCVAISIYLIATYEDDNHE